MACVGGVSERLRTHSIESSGKLKISEQHWDFTAEDLKDLGEIGRGAYGSVNKMVHKPSSRIMAVKVRRRCSGGGVAKPPGHAPCRYQPKPAARFNRLLRPQRIRSTVDEKEQKQLLMDLDVVMRSSDCPYIVQFYGALFREVSWPTRPPALGSSSSPASVCLPGRLLDLYGADGYLARQVLQICVLLAKRRDS